jgi:CHAT domain-containing protein
VFHVLDDRTAVFAVGRDGKVTGHITSIGRDALTARVAALREAMNVDSGGRGISTEAGTTPKPAEDYRSHAQSLYRELVAPVAGALPQDEVVAVEPHGPLWLVPFAALEDEKGRPLIERWSLTYAPSAAIVEEIRREPAYVIPKDLKALIIGNPTPPNVTAAADDRFRGLRATFQPLPGAEEEAKAIGSLLPENQRTVLIGRDAALSAVESQVSKHSLLHLASHALAFSSGPLDSFVMLAAGNGTNGQLTARKVLTLTVPADLVTLSACQTGMGMLSGDGVIGLSRSFLVRGARSVLVSQWSVSDKATAALMTGFYRRYLTGKVDKARALQQAMNEVRSTPGFEHPKFWAPFVLIGSER